MEKVFKIFVDFDGTISKQDIGEAIFRKFGNPEIVGNIIEKLLSDQITAKESWLSLCGSVENLNKNELDEFIDSMEIDETFSSFVDYCKENEMELFVISDGFNYYIDKVFERENLKDLKYYSNKLVIDSNNKLVPSFPYLDHNCTSSANCKRNHIINNSGEDEYTIFIGDGNSDKYTVQFCDFIFAKDDLLKYCEIERITYFPFNNFNDVTAKIDELRSRKRLKKRYQAELKRREIYINE
jgi:2-hydroxy-3-keto-5-methylthiopentenyl-1-phosphate phosphatase